MKNLNIKKLVKPNVRALRAYEAKEIPARVKLDANESPYGFALKHSAIATNRYPDPECKGLRRALARQLKVPVSNILAGNGSDELIYYLITTFGGSVMYPAPSFVMFGHIARSLGEKAVEVPLERDFDLDLKKTLEALRRERPRLVFISSPNNPTGNCFSTGKILKIIEASRGIVVVDEAYQAFAGGRGFVPFLSDYRNLVVMRTLSKVGMAALRVGYIVADEDVIGEVNKVRLPFNVNSLSQLQAAHALRDMKGLRLYIQTIMRERDRLQKAMAGIKGLTVYPSEANFILFRVQNPGRAHAGLLGKGVLIRNLDAVLKGALRVTVGTEKENNAFLKALKETVKDEKSKGKKKN